MRTTVASRRMATVRPRPIWLTVATGAAAKEAKTAAMIAAAPVITPAVLSRPKRIAALALSRAARSRAGLSRMRARRKTA